MPDLWRPLSVSGDVRALTYTGIDAKQSMAFRSALQIVPWIKKITLNAGESARKLPIMSNGSSLTVASHVPGVAPTPQQHSQSYVTAEIDDIRELATDIPYEDVNLSIYADAANAVSRQAYRLALEAEQRAFRVLALAARTASSSGLHNGGNRVEITSTASVAARYPLSTTGGGNAEFDLATLAALMDADEIPRVGRVAFVCNEMWNALGWGTRVPNRDYTEPVANSPITRDPPMQVAGFTLYRTTNLPSTTVTSDLSKYNGDFLISAATGSGQPAALAMYVGPPTPDGTPAFGPLTMLEKIAPELRYYPDYNGARSDRYVNGWRYSFTKVDVWCAGEIAIRSGS